MRIHVIATEPGARDIGWLEEGEHPGLTILAVADAVRIERERLGHPNPLAPVIVRVWPVTDAGTYLMSGMVQHTVYPQPADSEG